MKLGLLVILICGFVCQGAHAQPATGDPQGTWQAVGVGQESWSLFLRVDGSNLAGIVSSCGSSPAALVAAKIYEVRVSRDTIQFRCTSADDGRIIRFKGVRTADQIEFTYEQTPRSGVAPSTLSADSNGMFGPATSPRIVAKRVKGYGQEFAAMINLSQKNVKVEGTLFLPSEIARIRSVVVLANSGTSWDGMAATLYRDEELRTLAAKLASGLLLIRLTTIDQTAFLNVVANAAVGTGDGLLKLLDRLASDTGRRELSTVPLVLWGHSRSAQFAATFAADYPERTIAFVRYHSGANALPPNIEGLSRVPALLFYAGKDQILIKGSLEAAEGMWKDARARGAPWTFCVEPNARHQDPADLRKANALFMPWLASVIRDRVPLGASGLRPVTDTAGWMGDHLTGDVASSSAFVGRKSEASWLPDEASAHGWQVVLKDGSR